MYNCDCGHKLVQNDKYCGNCGRKIDSEEWEIAIRDRHEIDGYINLKDID